MCYILRYKKFFTFCKILPRMNLFESSKQNGLKLEIYTLEWTAMRQI